MQYLGGKHRLGKPIAAIVDRTAERLHAPVLEPFAGALNVTAALTSPRVATDACKPLITLYRALRSGWAPPRDVDRPTYDRVKARRDPADPLTAFIGFGCSFGGKWFGGHDGRTADNNGRGMLPAATRAGASLLRKIAKVDDVPIGHRDYRDHAPRGLVVYCDPPYAGTTTYGGVADFDSVEFWNVARGWSRDNVVIVSEYRAPCDFVCVWLISHGVQASGGTRSGAAVERLYVHRDHAASMLAPVAVP
jgi:DNA adenine methylase